MLLADISTARGREVPVLPLPVGLPRPALAAEPAAASPQKEQEKKVEENAKTQGKIVVKQHGQSAITPLNYPFNFLVASATIPNWLSAYLNAYHPALQRLVSPNIHFLPKSLKTEYVSWTGGNKYADIERRLRKVWAEDAASGLGPVPGSLGDMSKVLIFCNQSNKVDLLGTFLDQQNIKNIPLSSASPIRKRGSNHHLDGFLKRPVRDTNEKPIDDWSSSWVTDEEAAAEEGVPPPPKVKGKDAPRSLVPIMKQGPPPPVKNDPMNVPHVMITTSLLSRGLDFSPNIKYVFIIDEPMNMIDFLHRAGRTGRAGATGRVVVFNKMEGRGSERGKRVREKIKALVTR
jgi:ATP-dependent RNA helicase MRH4